MRRKTSSCESDSRVFRSVTCIEGPRERGCGGRDTPGFRAYAALSITPPNHSATNQHSIYPCSRDLGSYVSTHFRGCGHGYTPPSLQLHPPIASLKLYFFDDLNETTHEEFDSLLSNLPISPIVEFEVLPIAVMPTLPRLTSKNRVRPTSPDFVALHNAIHIASSR